MMWKDIGEHLLPTLYWRLNMCDLRDLESCSNAIHHDIQAACPGRYKHIEVHQRQLVHDFQPAFSIFVLRETDRCVHLEDIIMACMHTVGDRSVTSVCVPTALLCFFLSLISTLLPSGRLAALTGPVMNLSIVGLFGPVHEHACFCERTREHICRNKHRNTCAGKRSLKENATHAQKPKSGAYGDTWSSKTSCVQNLEKHKMQITVEEADTGLWYKYVHS